MMMLEAPHVRLFGKIESLERGILDLVLVHYGLTCITQASNWYFIIKKRDQLSLHHSHRQINYRTIYSSHRWQSTRVGHGQIRAIRGNTWVSNYQAQPMSGRTIVGGGGVEPSRQPDLVIASRGLIGKIFPLTEHFSVLSNRQEIPRVGFPPCRKP